MSIKSELLSLQHSDPQNVLHCDTAVQWAAENPGSMLYAALEWDDAKAANAHRLAQVRQLIQLHVTSEDGSPLLVSLSIDRPKGGGYRGVDDVAKVPDLRNVMLNDALNELERVRTKYEHVSELIAVWQAADEAAARIPASQQRRGRRRVTA